MQIQYKIINYLPEQASLVVNYFTEDVPDGLTYNLDIPIIDGQLADAEEVMKLIEVMTPKAQLERIAHLQSLTNHPEHLTALIQNDTADNNDTTQIDGDIVEVTRRDIAKLQLTLAIQRVLADMAGATV